LRFVIKISNRCGDTWDDWRPDGQFRVWERIWREATDSYVVALLLLLLPGAALHVDSSYVVGRCCFW